MFSKNRISQSTSATPSAIFFNSFSVFPFHRRILVNNNIISKCSSSLDKKKVIRKQKGPGSSDSKFQVQKYKSF